MPDYEVTDPVDAITDLTVVTATWLETWAANWTLPRGTTVVRAGVGLSAGLLTSTNPVVICGLAGALSAALRPGTVIIPVEVGLPSGQRYPCHPPLVAALAAAARTLGFEPVTDPLLTAPGLVTGPARGEWAARGFAAVDMETGLLLPRQPLTATVRVILDTPERELSGEWERPWRALLAPWRWPEACRLIVNAPRAALTAAAVIKAALPPRISAISA